MDFEQQYEQYRVRADQALVDWLPGPDTRPSSLHTAMRYSLDAGGKRLRPMLVFAAAAVETIHTYSLIHDDLPCMDDSDLRRGKPTCHKQFDEAMALLAGDALLTEAFGILVRAYNTDPALACALVADLADASGSEKLIGGQTEDLIGEDAPSREERLDYIHANKTAALITACLLMGFRLSDLLEDKLESCRELGHHLGVAFQIIDDILDATADTETLGKTAGLDEKNGTLTYTKLYGIDTSRQKAREHTGKALDRCRDLAGHDQSFLSGLVKKLEHRIS